MVDWHSKLQQVPATSTGEAEYTGVVHGMQRSVLPMQILAEDMLAETQKEVKLLINIDNDAAKAVADSSNTKQMKYLRKTQRIHEAWVHNQVKDYKRSDRKTQRVDSGENLADLMTKALDVQTFWRFLALLGMMQKYEFGALFSGPKLYQRWEKH